MALPKIRDVRLLPPFVSTACYACRYPNGNHVGGKYVEARCWIVAPDGVAVGCLCDEHGASTVAEMRKVGEYWSLAPIYHDDPTDRTERDRTTA